MTNSENFTVRLLKALPLFLFVTIASLIGAALSSPSHASELPEPSFSSSEPAINVYANGLTKIYLSTFRPNMKVFFKVNFHNTDTLTISSQDSTVNLLSGQALQFSLISGATLAETAFTKPLVTYKNSSGTAILEVFPVPADFPVITLAGNTSLISKKEILSTPVVTDGSYAVDSIGTSIKYFNYSPNNLIGFRKLSDSAEGALPGGQASYAYLEQKDFSVSATSPGVWNLLDSSFNPVGQVNSVATSYGNLLSDGHDITTSPQGNPVVITTPTRAVDSSWLKRRFNLPVLDCDIAEVVNGKAIHQFSFWDWVSANKAVSEPILDAMQLYNDPQNPTTSPIDICHANSLEYNKAEHEYLVSLRSPSLLLILSSDLKTVKAVLNADSALQHFARFASSTHITALGNYPNSKNSQFLNFTLKNDTWTLTKIELPVDVGFCGNTSYLDATHIWLAGGCGTFAPNTLGVIYQVNSTGVSPIGKMTISNFSYSYRGDLIP